MASSEPIVVPVVADLKGIAWNGVVVGPDQVLVLSPREPGTVEQAYAMRHALAALGVGDRVLIVPGCDIAVIDRDTDAAARRLAGE